MGIGLTGLVVWSLVVTWHKLHGDASSVRGFAFAPTVFFLLQILLSMAPVVASNHPQSIEGAYYAVNVGLVLGIVGWGFLVPLVARGPAQVD